MKGYKKLYSIWPYSQQRSEYFRMQRTYTLRERAEEVFDTVRRFPSPNQPMLIQEETALYSDLVTKQECAFTQYTALL